MYGRGHAWQGACVVGGMHCRGGACMVGACMAGETATAVDSMHPTGMHSCLFMLPNNFSKTTIGMSGMPEFSDLLEKTAFTELPASYFTKIHLCVVTARKQSLGQGNVFTSVCHSVHKGGV